MVLDLRYFLGCHGRRRSGRLGCLPYIAIAIRDMSSDAGQSTAVKVCQGIFRHCPSAGDSDKYYHSRNHIRFLALKMRSCIGLIV
jgi:hypothetical protein